MLCSPDYLVFRMGSIFSQLRVVVKDMAYQSWALFALFTGLTIGILSQKVRHNFHLSVMVIFFFCQFLGPVSWKICLIFNFWHFFQLCGSKYWQKMKITKIPTLKWKLCIRCCSWPKMSRNGPFPENSINF